MVLFSSGKIFRKNVLKLCKIRRRSPRRSFKSLNWNACDVSFPHLFSRI